MYWLLLFILVQLSILYGDKISELYARSIYEHNVRLKLQLKFHQSAQLAEPVYNTNKWKVKNFPDLKFHAISDHHTNDRVITI